MKKVNLFLMISCLAVSSIFISCNKDNSTSTPDTYVTDAQDNSIASAAYDDVITEVDAALGGSLKSAEADSAPVVKLIYWRRGEFRKSIFFNNITRRGKVKSGTIFVTVTYPVTGDTTSTDLWVKTITFDVYKVGGRQLEGTKTITYKGIVDGFPEWTITLVGGKVTFRNGKTITYEYNRTRKMIQGYNTPLNLLDNVFRIDGNGSGTNRKGIAFTTSSDSLIIATACPYFRAGVVTYETANKKVTITYTGGDNCSTTASIVVDGKTEPIDTDTESN